MPLGNTASTADAILKDRYSEDELELTLLENHPVLGLIEKNSRADENMDGRQFVQPIYWGAGQARSHDFPTAQTMSTKVSGLPSAFKVAMVEDHAVATISTQLLKMSETRKGAFAEMSGQIVDEQLSNMRRQLSFELWHTATGSRGQIGTIGNGFTTNSRITLKNTRDIIYFEVGMQLDVHATDGAAKRAYGSNGHGLYVIGIDLDSGNFDVGTTPVPYTGSNAVAVTDAADGVPGALVNDYMTQTGDLNACFDGFPAWLPATVASNDSFHNVNRSVRKDRLAGHYIDGSSSNSIGAALLLAGARIQHAGGKATHAFMDPIRFAQLSLEQEDKRRLVEVKSTNSLIGYLGIEIATAAGQLVCLADPDCPSTDMYVLDIDSWILASVGQPVGIWDYDSLTWLRHGTQSGMELRLYGDRALVCRMPRNNARIVMPSSN